MHLASYLGFLLGIHHGKSCSYVVISKDTDYDNIIKFWQKKGKNVHRRTKIAEAKSIMKKSSNKSAVKTKGTSRDKVSLNNEIQKKLSMENYDRKTTNEVASLVIKHYGERKMLSNIRNDLEETYNEGLELYRIIKPVVSKYVV